MVRMLSFGNVLSAEQLTDWTVAVNHETELDVYNTLAQRGKYVCE
jgi:hypothetical protein